VTARLYPADEGAGGEHQPSNHPDDEAVDPVQRCEMTVHREQATMARLSHDHQPHQEQRGTGSGALGVYLRISASVYFSYRMSSSDSLPPAGKQAGALVETLRESGRGRLQ
jgi:hypothetical protein